MRGDFAVFILSHGRPDNILTLNTLKKGNYTGKWFIVIDNEDEEANRYYELYGADKVIMFDKPEIAKTFDTADTIDDRRAVIYARNACFNIAKDMGLKYFLELDDDYTSLLYRWIEGEKLASHSVRQMDIIFSLMIEFLETSGATTVAFAQGGDLLGGLYGSKFQKRVLRKAMNTFFCSTEKPFQFVGRINEDVNTYTTMSTRGKLFFSITDIMITQPQTQANSGGMTELYLNTGTYMKSFYSVMMCPSAVTIWPMGRAEKRLHHKINWERCAPKIISDKYKKGVRENVVQ